MRYSNRTIDLDKDINIEKYKDNPGKEASIHKKPLTPKLPTKINEAYETVDFRGNEGIYDIVH